MQIKLMLIQIHFGPIIKACGSSIPSKGQIVFKPSQTRMLKGCLNNEELILRQVQPTQGESGTQDQLENCEGLSLCKNIINFNLSLFGIGHKHFSLQKGLWFLFHHVKIDHKQIRQLHELVLYDLLSQFSWVWSMTRTNNESFLGLGP